ncbi:MAG TPA: decaprenyl-phosphate phosphoribosyltransferase [Myxococcota bacterium]|nr:decaprenyl-phosphate phosphoribosyltransferase [Myxococcota bacterium]HNH46455.1 decaprenyl-phosphate phosphoribosyltransferase [Myxococcota bacterium]
MQAPPRRSLPHAIFVAMRPKQWIKNVLLFAALIFSSQWNDLGHLSQAFVAFWAFCLLSSTGYIYNDLRDVEADRKHPSKRFRPLAAGDLGSTGAWVVMAAAITTALGVSYLVSPLFCLVSLLYFVTTISYSTVFKHYVILDVMFLAACYIWRAVAGAVAISVVISPWLLVCTAFFALFLGFNKRRGELALLDGRVLGTRKALAQYSPAMLQEFQAITTSGTILSYTLYTVLGSPKSPWLLLTLPCVLYGVFRYIYLMDQKGEGSAPDETLLRDRPLLLTCLIYLFLAVAVLFFAPSATVAGS